MLVLCDQLLLLDLWHLHNFSDLACVEDFFNFYKSISSQEAARIHYLRQIIDFSRVYQVSPAICPSIGPSAFCYLTFISLMLLFAPSGAGEGGEGGDTEKERELERQKGVWFSLF